MSEQKHHAKDNDSRTTIFRVILLSSFISIHVISYWYLFYDMEVIFVQKMVRQWLENYNKKSYSSFEIHFSTSISLSTYEVLCHISPSSCRFNLNVITFKDRKLIQILCNKCEKSQGYKFERCSTLSEIFVSLLQIFSGNRNFSRQSSTAGRTYRQKSGKTFPQ